MASPASLSFSAPSSSASAAPASAPSLIVAYELRGGPVTVRSVVPRLAADALIGDLSEAVFAATRALLPKRYSHLALDVYPPGSSDADVSDHSAAADPVSPISSLLPAAEERSERRSVIVVARPIPVLVSAAAPVFSAPVFHPCWRRCSQSAGDERQHCTVADLPQFLSHLRETLRMVEPKLYVLFDGTDREKVDDDADFRAWASNPATTFYVYEDGQGKGKVAASHSDRHSPRIGTVDGIVPIDCTTWTAALHRRRCPDAPRACLLCCTGPAETSSCDQDV